MNAARWLGAFLICLGLVFAQFAFAGWTNGDPAPVTFLAPKATVRVVSAEVVFGRKNGVMRYVPRITVRYGAEVVDLRGLTGSFHDNRQGSAEAAIRGYTVGETVTVRRVNDALYADKTDWFKLMGAVWVSLFAMIILAAGGVLARTDRIGNQKSHKADGNPDNSSR
ncbi:MAG: hypothetical protein KIS86_00970 [Devosia sp.]|nr:hypothetical protein [Devosia sp.]